MTSILKPWVQRLGIRHQGCLISAIRGCDGVPKDDPSKALVRCLRDVILVPHCGDAAKAASFIEHVHEAELKQRMDAVVKNFDHYPTHFTLHLMHAAQVIGYCLDAYPGFQWRTFYNRMCFKMHVMPEPMDMFDRRLSADEKTFAAAVEIEANTPITVGATGAGGTGVKLAKNEHGRFIGRPCHEQLPEALNKGYFDRKGFNVSVLSNHYSDGNDHELWEIGWHAANRTKRMHAEPRPREEGYDAYYDDQPVTDNPYQGIAIASGEWTTGWRHAANNAVLQGKIAAGIGHICDGQRGHNNQDCPDSEEHRMAGFDTSGFYDGHKPTTKELDEQATLNYRGIRP